MSRGLNAAATLALGLVLPASAGVAGLQPEKQAILERQLAFGGGGAPAPKDPANRPPYDPPRPAIPLEQIMDRDVEAPLSPALFSATTQWIDVVGRRQVAVYGGSATRHGGAAAIYVWITDLDDGRVLEGTGLFVAGALPGPARLTGVSSGLASFDYLGGSATFDLVTHGFHGH